MAAATATTIDSAAEPQVNVAIRVSAVISRLNTANGANTIRLAQLVYRVEHPDLLQVQTTRKLATEVEPGKSVDLRVDRTRTYLDPVREAMSKATIVDKVSDPGRNHLTRAVFPHGDESPFLAVEDALATRTDIAELPAGEVFRIEYGRDGVVRVSYMTGDDDERGRRDPFQLRERERWAAVYDQYLDSDAAPVDWGPGEPSDGSTVGRFTRLTVEGASVTS